jgi:hypothetical protein
MKKAVLPIFQRTLPALVRWIKQLEKFNAQPIGGRQVSLED